MCTHTHTHAPITYTSLLEVRVQVLRADVWKSGDLDTFDFPVVACDVSNYVKFFKQHGLMYFCVAMSDKFAALWPFLGICAEVFVLCAIIFLYERKHAKRPEKEVEKEETEFM